MKGTKIKRATAQAVLGRYARVLLRHPWMLAWGLLGVLGMQMAALATPIFLRSFFNLLAEGHATETQLIHAALIVSCGWLGFWAANRLEHFINLRMITRGMSDVLSDTYRYLLGHSYHFFISNFAGSLFQKVNKYTKAFQTMYDAFVVTFLPALLFIIGSIIILVFYNALLALILGVWVVLFVSFQIWASNARLPYRKIRADYDTRINAMLADTISNQHTISLFAQTDVEVAHMEATTEEWYKAGVRSWDLDAWVWTATDLLMVAIQIALLFGAIMLWMRDLLTLGDFVLIQTYLIIIFGKLTSIQNDLKKAYDALAEAGEMLEILQSPHDVQDIADARPLTITGGEIRFDSVSFSFHKEAPVLDRLSFALAGSEKVALVGPSGAGKSTITKLLLRMYDIPQGVIAIDGQNISKVNQESLRQAISFVPQEPVLFHRTLTDNIRYGKGDATDEEVMEAATKAHCHDFISQLPLGYNTFVGERGVKLSGGERQRVAIARAILKNAPILVLDEATSSLDSESESLIQDALKTLMQGKTVVVIAHRLSTIMKMDRILVIEKGQVTASGGHRKLMSENGLYKKLWDIQAGGFIRDIAEV